MTTHGRPSMQDARTVLRQAETARVAGRRMVARGERPMYRVEVIATAPGVIVRIVELPWLTGGAASMREVTSAGQRLVAGWLEVAEDRIEVTRA